MREFRQNANYNDILNQGAEEGQTETESANGGGNHGNRYSLPYGLCASEGINTDGMTPREAWDAWTSKTGRTKEDAEREHWGKEASKKNTEKQSAEKETKQTQTGNSETKEVPYGLKVGDIISSGGMKLKIIDVSNDGEKTLAEIIEGKSPSGLKKQGDTILFHKNSPLAQQAQKLSLEEENVQSNLEQAQNTPKTEEQSSESPKDRKFTATRYNVDEGLAQRALESYSFSDYKKGSATERYNSNVQKFEENVNELINKYKGNDTLTEEDWAEVESLAEKYSSNLANYTNESNRVEASYPSWVIAGPANYNTRKNDAKHSRLRSLYQENEDRLDPNNNVYLKKIKDILSGANIQSNDSNAVEKLQRKYDTLKAEMEKGKAMNAYFRKNKTLVGFPGISEEAAKAFDAKNASGDYFSRQPFMPYQLQNGNANLRRIQGRIDELKKAQSEAEAAKANPEAAKAATAAKYPKVEGVEVQENAEEMRVQLRFPGKPDDDTRTLLKSYGFRWSPTQGAWQRQLNDNGKYAARMVMQTLANKK